MSFRTRTIILAAVAALTLPAAALTPAFAAKGGAMKVLDPDNDGTVDLKEAQAAA